MASSRGTKERKSKGAYSSTNRHNLEQRKKQAVLHQPEGQRQQKMKRPTVVSDSSAVNMKKNPQTEELTSEEDGIVTTKVMRVVLSGIQKGKKKGQGSLSLIALAGACVVIGMYLVIPIMICLHITDTILAVLIAAFILTLMEGIVGIILVRIGTSRKLVTKRKAGTSASQSLSTQKKVTTSSIVVPMPTPTMKSLALPAVASINVSRQTVKRGTGQLMPAPDMLRRSTGQLLPTTDTLRLTDVASLETIQINPKPAVVPPLLKLPASS